MGGLPWPLGPINTTIQWGSTPAGDGFTSQEQRDIDERKWQTALWHRFDAPYTWLPGQTTPIEPVQAQKEARSFCARNPNHPQCRNYTK